MKHLCTWNKLMKIWNSTTHRIMILTSTSQARKLTLVENLLLSLRLFRSLSLTTKCWKIISLSCLSFCQQPMRVLLRWCACCWCWYVCVYGPACCACCGVLQRRHNSDAFLKRLGSCHACKLTLNWLGHNDVFSFPPCLMDFSKGMHDILVSWK